MSRRCNMVFVASRTVFHFRCGSSGRFTEFCCVGDAARTKHPANFATPRTGLATPDLEMLRSFLLHRNA